MTSRSATRRGSITASHRRFHTSLTSSERYSGVMNPSLLESRIHVLLKESKTSKPFASFRRQIQRDYKIKCNLDDEEFSLSHQTRFQNTDEHPVLIDSEAMVGRVDSMGMLHSAPFHPSFIHLPPVRFDKYNTDLTARASGERDSDGAICRLPSTPSDTSHFLLTSPLYSVR
ncbi:hypothetical protein J6590_085209 [Homalodisca vitripennis]|nr:hypothetical protein J6590_085209 [Homalodisca vitripennis]